MQQQQVYTVRELDLGSCHFSEPVKDDKNVTRSLINHKGASAGFVIQTPKINLRDSTPGSLDLLVSRNKDRHREFYHIISHLEDTAITQIAANSSDWFPKPINKFQVENMFRSSLHRPLEIDSPFVFRIAKLPEVKVEDSSYPVVCMIRVDGIVFGQTSARLDLRVVKIKVVKPDPIQMDAQSTHSSFYNDIASLAPANFKPSETAVRPQRDMGSVISERIVEEPVVEQTPVVEEPVVEQTPVVEEVEQTQVVEEPVVEQIPVDQSQVDQMNAETAVELASLAPQVSEEETREVAIPESVVAEVESVAEPVTATVDTETLKVELMKAAVENDFKKVAELTRVLNEVA